jgi:hypothetical protein
LRRYSRLEVYFAKTDQDRVELTFKEIEKIISFPLPAKAQIDLKWWDNNPFTPPCRPKPWQTAGFKVSAVDLINGKILFIRDGYNHNREYPQPIVGKPKRK